MIDKRIYTTQDLESMNVYDLRSTLRSLGGVPKTKNRRTMMDEIMDLQMGKRASARATNRGRKPKKFQDKQEENGVIDSGAQANKNIDSKNPAGYQVYTQGDLIVPVDLTVGDADLNNQSAVLACGTLEIISDYGILRNDGNKNLPNFLVSSDVIGFYSLKAGDFVQGIAVKNYNGNPFAVVNVKKINHQSVDLFKRAQDFSSLSACYPTQNLISPSESDVDIRMLNLVSPIGFGQRGLIIAPSQTGKSLLLKKLSHSIQNGCENANLFILLVGARPEDATEFSESVTTAELLASTFESTAEEQIRLAELTFNRAQRIAESGKNAVILLDSATNLVRAYEKVYIKQENCSQAVATVKAMQSVKKLLVLAKNTKDAGSLTVISTILVKDEKQEDFITEELIEIANMKVVLTKEIAQEGVYPAINVEQSQTAKQELLLGQEGSSTYLKIKNQLAKSKNATKILREIIQNTATNQELYLKFNEYLKAIFS